MNTLLSLAIGITLSAACGFRIFVPPLIISAAAVFGHLPLSPDWQWAGTTPALIAFATATFFEVAGYYIPWVDHILDIFSTPGAMAVGTMMAAAFFPDSDPLWQWAGAAIAGGGSAGIIQVLMNMTRLSSTALTGGFGNGVISTLELVGAVILSIMALFVPLLALALLGIGLIFVGYKGLQKWSERRPVGRPN